MVDKLEEPDSRYHATLVTNVADLVELLPRLNVTDDAELNRFAAEIKNRVCCYSAKDLKKNEDLRVSTAGDAAQLLSQMAATMEVREQASAPALNPPDLATIDSMFSHMQDYMEVTAA